MPRVLLVDDPFDSSIGAGWQTSGGAWSTPGGYITPATSASTILSYLSPFPTSTDSTQTEAIVTFDRISNADSISINPLPGAHVLGFDVRYVSSGENPVFRISRANAPTFYTGPVAQTVAPVPQTIPAFADPTLETPTFIQPGDPCTVEVRWALGPVVSGLVTQIGSVLINGTLRATFRTSGYSFTDYYLVDSTPTTGLSARVFSLTTTSTNTRVSRIQLWRHQKAGYSQTLFSDTVTRANGAYLSASADVVYPGFPSDGATTGGDRRGNRLTVSSNRLVMSSGDGTIPQFIWCRPTTNVTDQPGRPSGTNPSLRREISLTWQTGGFEFGVCDQAGPGTSTTTTFASASAVIYSGSGSSVTLAHNEKGTRRTANFNLGFTPAAGAIFTLFRQASSGATLDIWTSPLRLTVQSGSNVAEVVFNHLDTEISFSPWNNAIFGASLYLASSSGFTVDDIRVQESLPFVNDSNPADPGIAAQVYTGYPSSSAGALY